MYHKLYTGGLILFVVFVNDIIQPHFASKWLIYAVDVKLYRKIKTDDYVREVQNEPASIDRWADVNFLEFNVNECVVLSYYRNRNPVACDYNINGLVTQIRRVEIKDLGGIFDRKLTFVDHVDYTLFKAFKSLRFLIRSTQNFTIAESIISLYRAIVVRILLCGTVIWLADYDIYMTKLESIQHIFLRYLSYTNVTRMPSYKKSPLIFGHDR